MWIADYMFFTVNKTNCRLSKDILCKFDEQSIETLLMKPARWFSVGIFVENPYRSFVIGQLPELYSF